MGRPRSWTDEQMQRVIETSHSWSEVAGKLGLAHANPSIKARAAELAISSSHFRRDGMIHTDRELYVPGGDDNHPWKELETAARQADVLTRRRDTAIRQHVRRGVTRAQIAEHTGLTIRQVNEVLRGDA